MVTCLVITSAEIRNNDYLCEIVAKTVLKIGVKRDISRDAASARSYRHLHVLSMLHAILLNDANHHCLCCSFFLTDLRCCTMRESNACVASAWRLRAFTDDDGDKADIRQTLQGNRPVRILVWSWTDEPLPTSHSLDCICVCLCMRVYTCMSVCMTEVPIWRSSGRTTVILHWMSGIKRHCQEVKQTARRIAKCLYWMETVGYMLGIIWSVRDP